MQKCKRYMECYMGKIQINNKLNLIALPKAYPSNTDTMKQDKNTEDYMDNRQQKKTEMVAQSHKKNKQNGLYQSISDIFYRLPLPRLEKNNYKFLFDNIKENVELVLEQEDKVRELQKIQQQSIDLIQVKLTRPATFPPSEQLYKQKLLSGNALHRSLIYLRKQQIKDPKLKDNNRDGDTQPFLPDSHFIDIAKIKKQIPNLKLFLEDSDAIKRHEFKFQTENQLIFKDKSFPSSYQISKRAQILAKLYLLDLYRQQSRKLLIMDRQDEAELQKKRQINKIKQQMQNQKMKQGELIEDLDLLKQVGKILEWIQKRMNAIAYQEFKSKNGDRATQIKKSLQKLKNYVGSEPNAMNKLKILIAYKYKKGF